MKFAEFKEEVKKAYAKRFPNSLCDVYIFKCLGRSIYIDCRLAKDNTEVANGIMGNDMFCASMCINLPDKFDDDDDLPENLVMEWRSSFIKAKPESWLAYDAESIKYRKVRGDGKKIVKACDKYFQRLRDTVDKLIAEDRIHPNYAELVSRKVR